MSDGTERRAMVEDGRAQQFRLARIQTFNWGTFSGVVDVAIPEAGFLFLGPSGSGKSTLLDAHTSLLTPPKWLDFNVAAREAERAGRDRSAMSYVRGAWAQQTADNGEYVSQYLRTDSTWSVIAETYRNPEGQCVTLAQVFWVRGRSTAGTDVKKLHLVLQREFEMRELEFFAQNDFDVRRFKHELSDAYVREEFSAYQERFRGLLGIDSERALRLLHKTQSAKNLGDLNAFLRDFMLDPPETFGAAERLVDEFGELHAAHQAVVAARLQIETLTPARTKHGERGRVQEERATFEELAAGLDAYREQQRRRLLGDRIAACLVRAEGSRQECIRLRERFEDEDHKLLGLKDERRGLGGSLEQLQRDLEAAHGEFARRTQKHAQASAACVHLGFELPDGAPAFVEAVAKAKIRLDRDDQLRDALETKKDGLKGKRRDVEVEFAAVRDELAAMDRQRSNIPAQMLEARAQIARGLGLTDDKLPFAGELLDVAKDAAGWRGAIERVLHGFALSLLVDERHYAAVSGYINENHTGQRIVYYRMVPHGERRRVVGAGSLVRKLAIAQVPQAEWLRGELSERFDYECTDTLFAFRSATRAVTREGQVKQGHARHEKDDRHQVDDRRRWVLGFDNRERRELYEQRAGELGAEIAALSDRLTTIEEGERRQRDELLGAQTLTNLTWAEVDVASVDERMGGLKEAIAEETLARPELVSLDQRIAVQEQARLKAQNAMNAEDSSRRTAEEEGGTHRRVLEGLSATLLAAPLSPAQEAGLEDRFARTGKALALESIDGMSRVVASGLSADVSQRALRIQDLGHEIVRQFEEFGRRWPAESGGLDASLASTDDYLAKLARLETDGLPRYEERFMRLLQEQSDQNLTLLSTRLDIERGAIRERLELVNESLATAPFNPGTYLVIEPLDRSIEEVRLFKQSLKEALSQSFSLAPEVVERRFLALSTLVKRLGSQETVDKNWRNLVLDVRQHVEFVARELDENGVEVEVYRSGAGKSGGQRQKLTATCLAAALRYQLGGKDRALPAFATVVLDEAFDKADAEFTRTAMNIFATFGFHMIVATPLKSVMTLEPFIGGAGFVHIKDRKASALLVIGYDHDAKRLKLPAHVRDEASLS